MSIKAKILDSRNDSGSKCFLCRISLEDYIAGLPQTYQDYDIQREIVANVYLDNLVETVLRKSHIPPIVLVVDETQFERTNSELIIKNFKILDGLQRTFRLQAIGKTISFCLRLDNPQGYLTWSKFKLSREFSEKLREFNSNTDVLRAVLKAHDELGRQGLIDTLRENGQWFEVWTGLDADQEVKKMLTLNAGHKPVKTRHQLELLFLHLLPVLRDETNDLFKIVREKEVSSTQFSKNRENGHFHFAHIISSLLSLYEGKPVATSTGLIQSIQASETALEKYNDAISPTFLKTFISFLVNLDVLLAQQYGEIGTTWMGREVSLAGLFGALGSEEDANNSLQRMELFYSLVKSNPKVLNLRQFEKERNNLDLSKVNIGNVNRTAVFSAIQNLLNAKSPKEINWSEHFRRADQ